MVHIAVHQEWHQEKMQLQLRKPDSSSSQRTTQSEARASKGGSSPSRGSSPTSRGNSSPNSRSTSRQDKRGGKKKGRSLMELLTHSFKEDSDGPLDLNWAEAALEGPSTTKGSVDPKEEIAKAKKKLKKKDDRKKVKSHSPVRHLTRDQPPMAKFLGYGFVEREDFGNIPEAKLPAFVPRPPSEICKTYGHIFQILADPRVKKLKVEKKKQVHMPRTDGFGSKSSPNLTHLTDSTASSTGQVALPPLGGSKSSKLELRNSSSGIDAECRRVPGALRAQGSGS